MLENAQLREKMRTLNDELNRFLQGLDNVPSRNSQHNLPPLTTSNAILLQLNRKPTFASPINSSRHKYLAKKPSVIMAAQSMGRMNSLIKEVKSRLMSHFDNLDDKIATVPVMEKQIETNAVKIQRLQIEHSKLQELIDSESKRHGLELQLIKVEDEIREQQRVREELKKQNHQLMKASHHHHSVHHHRATVEDNSQFVTEMKRKGQLVNLMGIKCRDLENELAKMEDLKQRESYMLDQLEIKASEYALDIEMLIGPTSITGRPQSQPSISEGLLEGGGKPSQILIKAIEGSRQELENVKRKHQVSVKGLKMTLADKTSKLQHLEETVDTLGTKVRDRMLEVEKQYLLIEKHYKQISNLKVPDDAECTDTSYEDTPPDRSDTGSPTRMNQDLTMDLQHTSPLTKQQTRVLHEQAEIFNNRNLSPILSTKDEEDLTPIGPESLSVAAKADIRKSHTTMARPEQGFEEGPRMAVRA